MPFGDEVEQVALGGSFDVGVHAEAEQILPAAALADRLAKRRLVGRSNAMVVDRHLRLYVGGDRTQVGRDRAGEENVLGRELTVGAGTDQMDRAIIFPQDTHRAARFTNAPINTRLADSHSRRAFVPFVVVKTIVLPATTIRRVRERRVAQIEALDPFAAALPSEQDCLARQQLGGRSCLVDRLEGRTDVAPCASA